jgi:EAL domain-containing protein (putative c-di-GMP-specific phosphodiesterase class I)
VLIHRSISQRGLAAGGGHATQMGDRTTYPPPSNRLLDAPSAQELLAEPRVPFIGGVVMPSDLSTVFQPIVALEAGEVLAYEALVRCSAHGLSPTNLFERAAAHKSAGRLGRMVREIAVPLCSGTPLFVNLHPSELEEGWLVRPDDPIFSHDDDIYLEITESAPLTHFELCASVLREVCGRVGVHLVVDDLGAGYSNLKLIAELQPSVVKLDRNLIQDLDRKPRQQKLVAIVVHLCHDLGALVVAEGIETNGEYEAVRDSGAEYGQGYLFARPSFPIPAISWPPPPPIDPVPATRPSRRAGA